MKKAQETSKGELSLARNFEQLVELGQQGNLDANDSHVVHIVDWLWQYAFEQRASDIHVEPRRDVGLVRFRIDGVLHQVYAIPIPVLIAMTSRIKLLARMEIVEKRRPQDGRIKTVTPEGERGRAADLDDADGVRREDRDADLHAGGAGPRLHRARLHVRRPRALGADDQGAERHHPRHRAHRLGQDDDALLVAEAARDARGQRLHGRGPDRDDRAAVQPDAGAALARRRLRARRAHADAAGSRHHHGRRDPRPRDRRHGGAGGADRAPRAVDAAHQRRADRGHADARPRRCRPTCSARRCSA